MTEAIASAAKLLDEWFPGRSADEELWPGATLDAVREFLTPTPAPPGSRWCPDVVFGAAGRDGQSLSLDLYAVESGEERPGIVFIHGGGWRSGHRHLLVRQASDMAAKGYVTATISYRLSGEAKWPAALEDAKCAVRWMRTHATEIGLDGRRIAVAGGSAGGQLAAMIALTPGRFEGTGGWDDVASEVQAAVLYNPVLDLRTAGLNDGTRDIVEAFLGDADSGSDASPITQVSTSCPPILTRVGDQDQATPAATCVTFHRLLDAASVPNRLEIVHGMDHGIALHDHIGCIRAMGSFLAEHLG